MRLEASYRRKTLSLSAECGEWIDRRRTPRRDVTRQRCDRGERDRRRADRDGIDDADAKQKRAEQPRHTERTEESSDQARGAQHHALAEDEPDEVFAPSAKGRPYADFVRALHHSMGEHALDANRREQERHAGKYTEEPGPQAIRRPRVSLELVDRSHIPDRLISVNADEGTPDGVTQPIRIGGRTHDESGKHRWYLIDRHIGEGRSRRSSNGVRRSSAMTPTTVHGISSVVPGRVSCIRRC
jgi:hypothetical protein